MKVCINIFCYGLNVCVPLKFIYWNPILQCDGIWRWGLWEIISVRLGHESGALMMGFHSVQSLSHVQLFATPWIAAHQASLSITNSRSSLRLMSIKSVLPSSHLVLCRPLLLLPPIPPSIRVFSNESTLRMRWPKYWSFSFSTDFKDQSLFVRWQWVLIFCYSLMITC